MSDSILLRRIRAWGRHGADPGERDTPQPFDIDVVLDVDLSAAQRSDKLADTVDYSRMHAAIKRIVETTSYTLLERLGADILAACLSDARVKHAEVKIAKPNLLDGATPVVTVGRARGSMR